MIIFIFFLFCSTEAFAQSPLETMNEWATVAKNVDWSCLQVKVIGVCSIGPDPGVLLSYWQPTVVVETIKSPGGRQVFGSNLNFNEAHVYDFPTKLIENAALCPSVTNEVVGVRYLSEWDKLKWRRSSSSIYGPMIQGWGPLYPRTGFVIHAIPAVASGLNALRAVSVASNPIDGHVVEAPLNFQVNLISDKVQMAYPEKTMCMAPGADARAWETERTNSRDGKYMWLYWRYIPSCCKPIVPP